MAVTNTRVDETRARITGGSSTRHLRESPCSESTSGQGGPESIPSRLGPRHWFQVSGVAARAKFKVEAKTTPSSPEKITPEKIVPRRIAASQFEICKKTICFPFETDES